MLSRKLPTISKVLFSSLRCMSTINSIPIRNTQMLIDGKFVNATSGKTFETINPATEEVIATIAEGQAVDIDIAVQAARKAFDYGTWPKTSGRERAKKLYKLAELIQQHSEELAILESLDNGKPLHNAKNDVTLTWDHFQYYAGWADKMQGKTIPVDGDFLSYTLNEPIGVCGQIIPWNFPIVMAAWKLAPALAVGNTVVLKVAEQTPLSALRLGELILEAGIPEGVVNIVTGFGETAGTALALHHDVDKLAFTGSTAVGQEIMKMAGASNLKPVTLELGGKSASIVMDDIEDLDLAIDQTHFGLFFNQGQCCCAGSRIYVHEKIYDEYIEKMTSKIKKTVVGDPFNEETNQGPQVSAEQMDKILGYIKSGTEEGAKIVTGGERHGNKGYFVQPTLFTDVQDEMKISKEEIFGPVMNVMKFSSTDEVIKRANQSNYGLAAGIWTSNIDTANTMSRALRAGTVWINCYDHFDSAVPFGGYKMSGIGREKGEYALENYTQVKCVTTPLKNPAWL